MKKLLLILFIPFIVNAQQISIMDAVVLKEGSDAEYMEISYNGGSSWNVAINNCDGLWSNSNSKKNGTYTIPSHLGNSNTRIRFRFNTRDGCCGSSFGFFIDNVRVPTQQSTPIDNGIITNKTIDLSQNGAIIQNGPYISNQTLTYTNKMTINRIEKF